MPAAQAVPRPLAAVTALRADEGPCDPADLISGAAGITGGAAAVMAAAGGIIASAR